MPGGLRSPRARPNAAHEALASGEREGTLSGLITQNVDALHQRAGSRRVVDLHGRLDAVRCLSCGRKVERETHQSRMATLNPDWVRTAGPIRPDGDADLAEAAYDEFEVPPCEGCGGILKPDIVFFGESVPPARVERAWEVLEGAEALLVVGSSLVVWSGYRFAKGAVERGLELYIVNRGVTRADELAHCKIDGSCSEVLREVQEALGWSTGPAGGSH